MISGIVLAAGASTRMGQPKAALPLGQMGETVLARVVRTLIDGGVPEVVVVAGAHVDAVRAAGGPGLDKRAVEVSGQIKTVGTHTVTVRLHPEVTAQVDIAVVAS